MLSLLVYYQFLSLSHGLFSCSGTEMLTFPPVSSPPTFAQVTGDTWMETFVNTVCLPSG